MLCFTYDQHIFYINIQIRYLINSILLQILHKWILGTLQTIALLILWLGNLFQTLGNDVLKHFSPCLKANKTQFAITSLVYTFGSYRLDNTVRLLHSVLWLCETRSFFSKLKRSGGHCNWREKKCYVLGREIDRHIYR